MNSKIPDEMKFRRDSPNWTEQQAFTFSNISQETLENIPFSFDSPFEQTEFQQSNLEPNSTDFIFGGLNNTQLNEEFEQFSQELNQQIYQQEIPLQQNIGREEATVGGEEDPKLKSQQLEDKTLLDWIEERVVNPYEKQQLQDLNSENFIPIQNIHPNIPPIPSSIFLPTNDPSSSYPPPSTQLPSLSSGFSLPSFSQQSPLLPQPQKHSEKSTMNSQTTPTLPPSFRNSSVAPSKTPKSKSQKNIQSLIDISTENQKDLENPSKKIKQTKPRGKIAIVACQSCRKKHAKCDGNQPCSNCKRAKIECIYPLINRNTILYKMDPQQDLHISITSSEFSVFLESYQTHIKEGYGISDSLLPSINVTEFKDSQKFFYYSMLANGALALGDETQSKRLISMSKSIIPSIFSECDIFIVYGYALLAYYFLKIGDISQAVICVGFTRGLNEIWLAKSPQNFYAGFIKILCSLAVTKHYTTFEEAVKDLTLTMKEIEKMMKDTPNELYRVRVTYSLINPCLQLIFLYCMGETNPERLDQLLRITDYIIIIMDHFPPPLTDHTVYSLAIRACILYQQGKIVECIQTLHNILDRLSRLMIHAVGSLINVFNILIKLSNLIKNEELTRRVNLALVKIKKFMPLILQACSTSNESNAIVLGKMGFMRLPQSDEQTHITTQFHLNYLESYFKEFVQRMT